MELNIRKAHPADLDRIAEIEAESFPPEEAASREKYAWRLANYPDYFIVGESEGKIIGVICMIPMAAAVINDDIFEMERVPRGTVCAILDVMTAADCRGCGVAEQMLHGAIETAREQGMTSMALTCKDHLIHYYAKFGFENQGLSASVHGGAVWYDMVKIL